MQPTSLINPYYDDCYFSVDNGYLESKYIFIDGNHIEDRLHHRLNIGETGFGTGLNLMVLEESLLSQKEGVFSITFTTVEKYILEPDEVKKILSGLGNVSSKALIRHFELYDSVFSHLKEGWNSFRLKREWGELTINLFYGDVIDSFAEYPIVNDAWFLDGHSPDKNPEMWNSNVFEAVAFNSKKGTTFSTFTAAGVVKRGLRESGFYVKRKRGFGQKRHMILGSY